MRKPNSVNYVHSSFLCIHDLTFLTVTKILKAYLFFFILEITISPTIFIYIFEWVKKQRVVFASSFYICESASVSSAKQFGFKKKIKMEGKY